MGRKEGWIRIRRPPAQSTKQNGIGLGRSRIQTSQCLAQLRQTDQLERPKVKVVVWVLSRRFAYSTVDLISKHLLRMSPHPANPHLPLVLRPQNFPVQSCGDPVSRPRSKKRRKLLFECPAMLKPFPLVGPKRPFDRSWISRKSLWFSKTSNSKV